MADIVKKVDRNIPSPYRTQNFTSEEASTGDVLMVLESLGRPARRMTVECEGGDMRIRLNVYHMVYPRIPDREGLMNVSHLPYLTSGLRYKDASTAFVDIEAGSVYEFSDDVAIQDVEILVASGTFDIFTS
jgi:hypothetical protein